MLKVEVGAELPGEPIEAAPSIRGEPGPLLPLRLRREERRFEEPAHLVSQLSAIRERRGVFHSVAALRSAIQRFLDAWNDHTHPFTRVKTPDQDLAKVDHQPVGRRRDYEPATDLLPGAHRATHWDLRSVETGSHNGVHTSHWRPTPGPRARTHENPKVCGPLGDNSLTKL